MVFEHVAHFSNLNQSEITKLEAIDHERSVAKNTMVLEMGNVLLTLAIETGSY